MTNDAVLVVGTLFNVIWALFTEWKIPGTNTTPAGWFMFVLMTGLSIRFMKSILPGILNAVSGSSSHGQKGE